MQNDDPFGFADEIGPEKIIHIFAPRIGLKAVLAIDNVACGPSIGGVRMAPDVSAAEAFRLARAMTLKNAAAGLPHGGGKSVIFADPHMAIAEKEKIMRAFARAIGDIKDYIPGPDMGTDERCMAWVRDEIGRAVGLPSEIGGIPLDAVGATGYGVAIAAEIAAARIGVALDGARVAVQGFGSVGRHAARFLAAKGARLVAAADSHGVIHDPDGLDLARLTALKAEGGSVVKGGGGGARALPGDAIIDIPCDIWIPAARPDVIRADNARRLDAKLVVEGANIPVTPEADAILHARGVLSVPDFIANAGGVICGAVEYAGGGEKAAFQAIDEKITRNCGAVLEAAASDGVPPRQAATALARARVVQAMRYRR